MALFVVRGIAIALLTPVFSFTSAGILELPSILFATFGGLRGAVSLILAQMVVTEQDTGKENRKVTAQVRGLCANFKYILLASFDIAVTIAAGSA